MLFRSGPPVVDRRIISNRSEARFPNYCARLQATSGNIACCTKAAGGVKVSFFGVPNLPRLLPPHVANDNGLKVASLIDLAGTKASVLQMRAEAKDYIDMDALLRLGKIDLPSALAAAAKLYGPAFNPEVTLKALSYFDVGDLRALPEDMKTRLVVAAREVDLEHLPEIGDFGFPGELDHDHGHEL